MQIFILVLLLLISPIELHRHSEDYYELENLLNDNYDRPRHHSNKQYIPDQNNGDQYASDVSNDKQYNRDENIADQYIPSQNNGGNGRNSGETNTDDDEDLRSPQKNDEPSSSRKKVLNDNSAEFDSNEGTDQLLPSSIATNQKDKSDASTCINKYNTKLEQLVKVKELKNGAHLIRYVLIDKRTLSPELKVRESCMIACCSERTCDLAMLSEKPAHEGYKCYLFACNGSCPLASHQDYTIIIPKTDSVNYNKPEITKADGYTTSTRANESLISKAMLFRETSVILFLVFGVTCTTILFIVLCHYCRTSRKRGRKSKNYTVDEDYLINGLYL